MARSKRNVEKWAPWIVLSVVILLWEAICRGFEISDFIFPAPTAIVESLIRYAGPIAGHAMQTFWTTMAGFALGVVVGLVLGVIVGSSRLMYTALYPLMVGFNSIPKSAFVPVLVVWFGIGTVPAILTAFVICFFPITVNMATGLATIEPELEDVLRALGANRLDVLLKVGLPRSLPYFFGSLKVAITLAFVGSVVSETIAANDGIGYLMMSAGSQMRMPLVFAGLIVISVMAMAMYQVFAVLEKRMTGWATRGMDARA
ncbi:MAG: ABC transporter permease [Burkholderiales bacterium]